MKPKATIKVEGEIEDFTRIDNLYRAMKREALKLLKTAKIEVSVEYEEEISAGG